MPRPYEHHHGRMSIDAYLALMPTPILRVAKRHRTKEWSFRHVHSIPQAISNIDKSGMSARELDFWRRVYRYYLHDGDLPSLSDYPELGTEGKKSELVIPKDTPKTEMIRMALRHEISGLTSEDIRKKLMKAGHYIDIVNIRYCLSYLYGRTELRIAGKKKGRRPKKIYQWIEK